MVLASVYFHALPEEDDYEVHDERAYSGGCDGCVPAYIVRRADYDALRAENAELKRDAERYRWLRDCHGHDGQKNLTICEVSKWSLEPWSGDDPDRAIDKALAKHRGDK